MTQKELSQLNYLRQEILEIQGRIRVLEALATKCTAQISDMPGPQTINDKTGKYSAQIADLKTELEIKACRCYREFLKLNRYIEGVEDRQMRTILALRYIQGLTWQQVAYKIGKNDEQYPRKKHNAFIKKSDERTNNT